MYTILEPYIKPLLVTATGSLQQGSAAVVNNANQYEVFDNPHASDPTHSILSKDHFSQILNEPAGQVAIVIVKRAVKGVVQAWDDSSLDPNAIINDVLPALHHPYFADARIPIQNEMFQAVERESCHCIIYLRLTMCVGWFNAQPDKHYVLDSLTKDGVRNHKNHRKGTRPEHEQYDSFLPTWVVC